MPVIWQELIVLIGVVGWRIMVEWAGFLPARPYV